MKKLKTFELFTKGESANWKFKIGDYVKIVDMSFVWISDNEVYSDEQIYRIIETGDNNDEMDDQYVLEPMDDEYCTSIILANDEALEIVTDEEIAALKYNL